MAETRRAEAMTGPIISAASWIVAGAAASLPATRLFSTIASAIGMVLFYKKRGSPVLYIQGYSLKSMTFNGNYLEALLVFINERNKIPRTMAKQAKRPLIICPACNGDGVVCCETWAEVKAGSCDLEFSGVGVPLWPLGQYLEMSYC